MLLTDDVSYPRVYLPARHLVNLPATPSEDFLDMAGFLVWKPGARPLSYWQYKVVPCQSLGEEVLKQNLVAVSYSPSQGVQRRVAEYFQQENANVIH